MGWKMVSFNWYYWFYSFESLMEALIWPANIKEKLQFSIPFLRRVETNSTNGTNRIDETGCSTICRGKMYEIHILALGPGIKGVSG
jgi:hypothetical protein